MASKKWYRSKTLWVNVIAAVGTVLAKTTGFHVSSEEAAGGLAIINLILRAVTKTGLTLLACMVLLGAGCAKDNPNAQMTAQQCKDLLKVASLGVAECDRLNDAEKVAKCKHYAAVSIEVATAACGFIPDPEGE